MRLSSNHDETIQRARKKISNKQKQSAETLNEWKFHLHEWLVCCIPRYNCYLILRLHNVCDFFKPNTFLMRLSISVESHIFDWILCSEGIIHAPPIFFYWLLCARAQSYWITNWMHTVREYHTEHYWPTVMSINNIWLLSASTFNLFLFFFVIWWTECGVELELKSNGASCGLL